MKRQINLTEEQEINFINKTDPDLTIEIHEENMTGEDISFKDFFRLYQKKHLRKYGKTLPIK